MATRRQIDSDWNAAVEALGVSWYQGSGKADDDLRPLAQELSARFELADEPDHPFTWMADPGAFGSGIEGLLQVQVFMAMVTTEAADQVDVVVRVVRGLEDVSSSFIGEHTTFLLVSADLLDLLASVAWTWSSIVATGEALLSASQEVDEPEGGWWTRSNLAAGHDLEVMARGPGLGLVYVGLLRFRDQPVSWADVSSPERAGPPGGDSPQLDELVIAPMQFAVFHQWAVGLLGNRITDSPRHAQDTYADSKALSLLDIAMKAKIPTLHDDAHELVAVGFVVYWQAVRLRRFLHGLPRLLRVLCVPADRPAVSPALGRVGKTELQVKIMILGPLLAPSSDRVRGILFGLFEELQVFIGLVQGLTLIELGGSSDLNGLCHVSWDHVIAFMQSETAG